MSYRLHNGFILSSPTFCIVGCGGTGSFVAEGLCRLLLDRPEARIVLVDHDRVEPHNLLRQNYYQGDLGHFKSEALALRLSRQFDRPVAYSIYPFEDSWITGRNWGALRPSVIIGCVDTALARGSIARVVSPTQWLIDAGNGEHYGQILIGNNLQGDFHPDKGIVYGLPAPTTQQPELLAPAPPPPLDCALEVQGGQQSPTINQAMATYVLEVVRRLIEGTCMWMQLYIDLEHGSVRTVDATPENVSRISGVRVSRLIRKEVKHER